jgi:hypothetical protein
MALGLSVMGVLANRAENRLRHAGRDHHTASGSSQLNTDEGHWYVHWPLVQRQIMKGNRPHLQSGESPAHRLGVCAHDQAVSDIIFQRIVDHIQTELSGTACLQLAQLSEALAITVDAFPCVVSFARSTETSGSGYLLVMNATELTVPSLFMQAACRRRYS